MDVRIGITQAVRELEVELGDDAVEADVRSAVDAALNGDDKVLWLTDRRGRSFGVAAERIAYVEIGTGDDQRSIGFSI
ncbi:MAG: DUF3107 domain-containing protein [Microthrixaceae bacterium]